MEPHFKNVTFFTIKNIWGKPKLPKSPPSKVTSVGWGTWILIYQMGKAKYKCSKRA
jgi:hypothetical protein